MLMDLNYGTEQSAKIYFGSFRPEITPDIYTQPSWNLIMAQTKFFLKLCFFRHKTPTNTTVKTEIIGCLK